MQESASATTSAASESPAPETRLKGRWLILARLVWVASIGLTVGLFVASLPAYHERLLQVCADQCIARQLLPGEAAALERVGISLDLYAGYFTALAAASLLVSVAIAGVIFWRKSGDWVALLCSAMLVTFGATTGPTIAALMAAQPAWGPVVLGVGATGFTSLFAFASLFPNGRFIPRWSAALPPIALGWYLYLFTNYFYNTLDNLFPGLLIVFAALVVSAVFAQTYRYRRVSTSLERQQTKWVVFGFATLVLIMGMFAMLYFAVFQQAFQPNALPIFPVIVYTVFTLAPLLLPLSIAFSILRYRLWDIDFLISRSLIYGGLLVLLGAVFASVFFALKALLERLVGIDQSALTVIIPTLLVFMLFSPARRRVRALVDQKVYGIKVEYVPPTPTAAPPPPPLPRAALGPYREMLLIASGGMAEVYRAEHPTLNRPVAVKVLLTRLAQRNEFRRRFSREARTVTALKHPNIVQVFDYGEAEGRHYIVMEFIDGPNLADYLKERGALPLPDAYRIVSEVASALEYAHSQGVVHRDINPSNVMLARLDEGSGQRAVLMDFGVAKILDTTSRVTTTGGVVGTFDYIAPEQIQGAPNVDGRADVYALGVMTYQMVTGKLPFLTSHPAALLIAHLHQPPPDPRAERPDLPEHAASAILRAMAKDPVERFPSAGDFAAALAQPAATTG